MILRMHEKLTGRQILARLEELNRTQWLSCDQLLALQQAKLQRVVEYAYRYVPYYRRSFDAVGFQPADLRRDPACLAQLPTLSKQIIRDNWDDMLTTEPEHRRRLSKLSTSGSTGQALVFMQDSDFRDYATADIQRHMGWAGWQPGEVQALIWGASAPALKRKARTRLVDLAWNRFQINAFVMTEKSMDWFAGELLRRKSRILFGYASALHTFAQFVRRQSYPALSFDGIFSSAEMLFPPVRAFIEETFQCRMFNRYGSLELGGLACECAAHTGLHVSVEDNLVEILCDGRPAAPGETGDLTVTNLNNRGMPFIRYRIGDAGSWHPDRACPCGRAAPMLSGVEGRVIDSFKARDGRLVWAGFGGAEFRGLADPSIRQFQVVQQTLDHMLVRLVPAGPIPKAVLDQITLGIKRTFGDNVAVEFQMLDEIVPLSSGKHRYAISELNRP